MASVSSCGFLLSTLLLGTAFCQDYLVLNTKDNTNDQFITINPADSQWPAVVASTSFRPHRPTKILIHGFIDTYASSWWTAVVQAFLQLLSEDSNIFRLSWAGSALNYGPATTDRVGGQVADFVLYLINTYKNQGFTANNVHIIGHSLGAHTAGAAGASLKIKTNSQHVIGRITGLDPAGPSYSGMDAAHRLDPTDARVVDTIMTEKTSLGSPQAMGHLNFMPNNGVNQPAWGCPAIILYNPLMTADRRTKLCSHLRALDLFRASINGPGVNAYTCSSVTMCPAAANQSPAPAIMGYRTNLALATTVQKVFITFG